MVVAALFSVLRNAPERPTRLHKNQAIGNNVKAGNTASGFWMQRFALSNQCPPYRQAFNLPSPSVARLACNRQVTRQVSKPQAPLPLHVPLTITGGTIQHVLLAVTLACRGSGSHLARACWNTNYRICSTSTSSIIAIIGNVCRGQRVPLKPWALAWIVHVVLVPLSTSTYIQPKYTDEQGWCDRLV